MEEFENHYEIGALVLKYLKDELSTAEKAKLDEWLLESDHNRELFDKVTNPHFVDPELKSFSASNKELAWQKIEEATKLKGAITPRRKDRKMLRYAAIIAFALVSVTLTVYQFKQKGHHSEGSSQLVHNDIAPGGNKAVLTLADGTKIVLDEAKNGRLAQQQNVVITKAKDGQLIYDLSQSGDRTSGEATYNTIATPRGGQYQLILPDGTNVWLNSTSSLKFPAVFKGNERRVELSGEAYFEVAKDKAKPFYVSAKDMEVKVLGTHFNIAAYSDEDNVRATLLEGSVKVNRGTMESLILPGQEALATSGQKGFTVRQADTEKAVAWKNGYFLFRDESIESLMTTISRWYDMDVYYDGEMQDKIYGGKFSKTSNLSELLKSLELTGTIKFKVEGRRITVMP
ncbi:FecR family protein [Arcticibacter tournemirensis]